MVHVLMQQGQAEEVQPIVGGGRLAQQGQGRIELRGKFAPGGIGIGQGQLPARDLRYLAGVIQRIARAGRP